MNTGVDEKEQWRARIMRALDELRDGDRVHDANAGSSPPSDDTQAERTEV